MSQGEEATLYANNNNNNKLLNHAMYQMLCEVISDLFVILKKIPTEKSHSSKSLDVCPSSIPL